MRLGWSSLGVASVLVSCLEQSGKAFALMSRGGGLLGRRSCRSLVASGRPERRLALSSSSSSSSCVWACSGGALGEEVDPGVVGGLEIVKYPHPALRAPNVAVAESELEAALVLSRRMLDLMYEAKGVGLAAPQVGINKRLMVFNPEGKRERWLDEIVLVNPTIVASSEGVDTDVEGCLSFPEMSGHVERKRWIKVEAMSPKGKRIKKKYTGWVARIFQHEYDHLDGIVYVDRIADTERDEMQPMLDDLVKGHDEQRWGPAAL